MIRRFAFHHFLFPLTLTASGLLHAEYDSRYYQWAVTYADRMIQDGRDRHGTRASPLFVSMLQRDPIELIPSPKHSLANLSDYGVRQHDRSWNAGNLLHDRELYALLYALTTYTGDPGYAKAANDAIAWFFGNTQSPVTGLLPWGEHTAFDVERETHTTQTHASRYHEMYAWEFWPQTHALTPEAVEAFALGLWNHQVLNQATGDFNRHCRYDLHYVENSGNSFPRYGGNMISTWGHTYRLTQDTALRSTLLTAIDRITGFLQSRRSAPSHAIPAGTSDKYQNVYWPSSTLELACEVAPIADQLPEPVRGRLLQLLHETDTVLLGLHHDLGPAGQGFLANANADTLTPISTPEHSGHTSFWSPGYGNGTAADMALLMLLRADRPHLTDQQRTTYRSMAIQAANRYLTQDPPTTGVRVPASYAAPIRLLVQVYNLTQTESYLLRAQTLADQAHTLFVTGPSPLPQVTTHHDHYETITGGDDLMLAFLDLHLASLNARSPGGIVSILHSDLSTNETTPHFHLRVKRSGNLSGTVRVQWTTVQGTALPGADYVQSSGTLTWDPTHPSIQEILIPLLNDDLVESPVETFSVVLSSPTGDATVDPILGSAVLQIQADDSSEATRPETTHFLINFGESAYTGPPGTFWQTLDMSSGSGAGTAGDPVSFENLPLTDTKGQAHQQLRLSLRPSGVGRGEISLHTDTLPHDFGGNPFSWFDPNAPEQREVFVFNGPLVSPSWHCTVSGFTPTDIVRFEWVARRSAKPSHRGITLTAGPVAAPLTLLLNDKESDQSPQFASVEFTGASDYSFTLANTSNDSVWTSAVNAMSIQVTRQLSAGESWRKHWFGVIENQRSAADRMDPDSDGILNLYERAFKSNPRDGTQSVALPHARSYVSDDNGQTFPGITYRQVAEGTGTIGVNYTAAGVIYSVFETRNLDATWQQADLEIISIEDDPETPGLQKVTVRSTTPTTPHIPHFLRLNTIPVE